MWHTKMPFDLKLIINLPLYYILSCQFFHWGEGWKPKTKPIHLHIVLKILGALGHFINSKNDH